MRTKNREGVGGWARVERLSECWCVGIWALKLFWSKRGQKQSMQMCGLVGMKLRANVEQYFWIIGCGVDKRMWSSTSESLGMELTSECGAVLLNGQGWRYQSSKHSDCYINFNTCKDTLPGYLSCVGLARTVYIRRIWPYIVYFPCHKYHIYTVYIWFWPTLVMCTCMHWLLWFAILRILYAVRTNAIIATRRWALWRTHALMPTNLLYALVPTISLCAQDWCTCDGEGRRWAGRIAAAGARQRECSWNRGRGSRHWPYPTQLWA